jgi:integrase
MELSCSFKLCIRKDAERPDGTASLYIQVIINKKIKRIPLKIFWPVSHFRDGSIVKRSKVDQDFNDYSIIINSEKSKINDIFKLFRLSGKTMTMDTFFEHYNNGTSKLDFIAYWESKMKELYKRKRIEYLTLKTHTTSFNKLKEFRNPLMFLEINEKLLEQYEYWLKLKYKSSNNTIWARLKDFRTYCNHAREEMIVFDYPFDNYKGIKYKNPDIEFLTKSELKQMYDLWMTPGIKKSWNLILRQFLFTCFTSLRISDVKKIGKSNIINNELVFIPHKNRKRNKILRIPLTEMAKKFLVDNDIEELFKEYAEQYCNRVLKDIASELEIKKKLTNHVGRHTFATMFLESGGSVEVLQQIMGHSKIQTTMIYVHITDARKKEQLKLMDNIF